MRLQGVIFDWAGTVVDHGSRAPVEAIVDVFLGAGIPITNAEARMSMGLAKKDHIRSILEIPRVREDWTRHHGAAPDTASVDKIYEDFIPVQMECLERFSAVIGGVSEAVEGIRSHGIRIGSTTGYTRQMLDFLIAHARKQGFVPDCAVCPEDVPGGGRPAPWMCYMNAIWMQTPLNTMVKVGDTPSDIQEGLNAGMWTIGITRTGNQVGLTQAEWDNTAPTKRQALLIKAEQTLRDAGAHYLAASVGESLDALKEIAARIAAGDHPIGERAKDLHAPEVPA